MDQCKENQKKLNSSKALGTTVSPIIIPDDVRPNTQRKHPNHDQNHEERDIKRVKPELPQYSVSRETPKIGATSQDHCNRIKIEQQQVQPMDIELPKDVDAKVTRTATKESNYEQQQGVKDRCPSDGCVNNSNVKDEKYQHKILSLKIDRQHATQTIEKLQKAAQDAARQVRELSDQLKQEKATLSKRELDLKTAKEKHIEAEAAKNRAERDLAAGIKQLKRKNNDMEALKVSADRVSELEKELSTERSQHENDKKLLATARARAKERENARKSHELVIIDLGVRVRDAESQIEQQDAAYKSLQADHQKKVKEIESFQLAHSTLQKKSNDLQRKLQDLRSRYKAELQGFVEIKSKLLSDLQKAEGLNKRYTTEVDDDSIKSLMNSLKAQVCTFVDAYAQAVDLSGSPIQLDSTWRAIVSLDTLPVFISTGTLYLQAFEAYVWRWLYDLVFTNASSVWAAQAGKEFSGLCVVTHLKMSKEANSDKILEDFHDWRANGAHLLNTLSESTFDPEDLRPEATQLVKTFQRLCGNLDEHRAVSHALEIIKQARVFDRVRRSLKSEMGLSFSRQIEGEYCSFGFPLDSATMESRGRFKAGYQAPIVDMVTAPELYKRGTNEGTQYHLLRQITKLDVVCDVGKRYSADLKRLEGTQIVFKNVEDYASTKQQSRETEDARIDNCTAIPEDITEEDGAALAMVAYSNLNDLNVPSVEGNPHIANGTQTAALSTEMKSHCSANQ